MNSKEMDRALEGLSLGRRVRALRKWRGLTQRELARAAGISRATVNYLERGKLKYVFPETLAGLRKALGVAGTVLRQPPTAQPWVKRRPSRQDAEPRAPR